MMSQLTKFSIDKGKTFLTFPKCSITAIAVNNIMNF